MQGFVIKGINHLGLVPKDLQKAKQFFGQILHLASLGEEDVKDQGVRTSVFTSSQVKAGASESEAEPAHLELLDSLHAESPIAQYLAKKGGGIHHLALEVDQLSAAMTYLQQQGVELIDSSPRRGVAGSLIAFIHPRSTGGILVELVQRAQS